MGYSSRSLLFEGGDKKRKNDEGVNKVVPVNNEEEKNEVENEEDKPIDLKVKKKK